MWSRWRGATCGCWRRATRDALLDEEAFEHEEFLPYWAELWPSAIALARVLARRPLTGRRVLELGCGLGPARDRRGARRRARARDGLVARRRRHGGRERGAQRRGAGHRGVRVERRARAPGAAVAARARLGRALRFSVAYAIPIVFSGWSLSQRWVAGISAMLMFFDLSLGYLSQPVGGAGFVNLHTAISFARLLIIAGVVHVWVRTLRELDRNRTSLERQNTELENMNDELRHREQETVRQSEELQSQTEELERQGEELRLTNEELSDRERMLEQLLELSRSLTAELEPSEVDRKICESLGLLTEGQATAITERQGNNLVLRCHHGFGEAGPAHDHLVYSQSFSALIMSLGQTGYLEDIDLRKDLTIPQPKDGPAVPRGPGNPVAHPWQVYRHD